MFAEAATQLRWHYQWSVLHEFMPMLVGQDLAEQVLDEGPQWFRPANGAFIPLEFADAAYRYGHCQIRHRYLLNRETRPVAMFPDLLGFQKVPRERAVDWSLFFDAQGKRTAQRSKKIDGKLVQSLIQLPVAITGECEIEDYHSLAVRDLQRGQGTGLPSGETIARHLGIPPLTPEQIGVASTGWRAETPLWFYVLREAAACTGGQRLGPVGGRIVAEVLTGLVDGDRHRSARSAPNGGRAGIDRAGWSPAADATAQISRRREESYGLLSAFSRRYAAVLAATPERRKASRSALIVSAWVVGMPCGKPL